MFDHIYGNELVKQYLIRIVEKGMIGNSLLFAGPEGVGKTLFAEVFAKMILCQDDPNGTHGSKLESGQHPDLHVYRPEGKIGMHTIASMRLLSEEVYLPPNESPRKVFIVHDADRMLSYSANALLKTFEEPSPDTVIILLSNKPTALLPTILSRCRTVRFCGLSIEHIEEFLQKRFPDKNSDAIHQCAAMAQGSIGQAVRHMQKGGDSLRGVVLDFLGLHKPHYKQVTQAASAVASQIDEAKKILEDEMRAMMLNETGEKLSAAQKQAIEKEVEGAATMHALEKSFGLLEVVLGWYRDMHLLQAGGNPAYLIHSDYASSCEEALKRGALVPIETIQKTVAHVRLMLERSTSAAICFEHLFLKI